ncbi:sugar ABC transporter permease [Cutibacterium avidum]|uniref:carbohydrate ABC transporter permease n=2 Tax=Cutibacterium avidum TaxID=33010 RepID=UPI001C32945F|nr:ABC transporter permease [Cutibacterium avidum]
MSRSRASSAGPGRRRRKSGQTVNGAARFRKPWVPYLWVGVPLLLVIYFYVYPFFNTLRLSFTDTTPLGEGGNWVGLENYSTIFADSSFWTAVLNSVVYALIVVPAMTMLPLLLGVLVKEHVPGIGVFRTLYYLPAISSLVVIALAWGAILRDNGLVNNFLVGSGLVNSPVPFLTGRWWLIISSCLITLWSGVPYYMLMYLTALANIDKSLYEAAAMDGAGAVRTFFTVTVPGVRIMMAFVATLSMIGCLKIFTEVQLLSNGTGGVGGRSSTLTMYIRDIGLDPAYGSLGEGSAAAVFLFVMTVGFIILGQVLDRRTGEE